MIWRMCVTVDPNLIELITVIDFFSRQLLIKITLEFSKFEMLIVETSYEEHDPPDSIKPKKRSHQK